LATPFLPDFPDNAFLKSPDVRVAFAFAFAAAPSSRRGNRRRKSPGPTSPFARVRASPVVVARSIVRLKSFAALFVVFAPSPSLSRTGMRFSSRNFVARARRTFNVLTPRGVDARERSVAARSTRPFADARFDGIASARRAFAPDAMCS
jgi:hypothetical protein